MEYLIGTDEAGYGPNLGPLVISATLWRMEERSPPRCLYNVLQDSVTRSTVGAQQRIAIADSKQLYKPRGGLQHLERGWVILDGTQPRQDRVRART